MKIRTIKPDFWSSSKTTSVPREVRLLFIGLWNEADDEGRLLGSPKRLAGSLFPNDDDVDGRVVEGWLSQLASAGLITRYEVKGVAHVAVNGFNEHQKIDRRYPSRLPAPPAGPADNTAGPTDNTAGPTVKTALEGGRWKVEGGEGESAARPSPPPAVAPPIPEPEPETFDDRLLERSRGAVVADNRNARNLSLLKSEAIYGRPQTVEALLAHMVDGEPLERMWSRRFEALDGKAGRPTVAEKVAVLWEAHAGKRWGVSGATVIAWFVSKLGEDNDKHRRAWERDGGARNASAHPLWATWRNLKNSQDVAPFEEWLRQREDRPQAPTQQGSGRQPQGPASGATARVVTAVLDEQVQAAAAVFNDEAGYKSGLALMHARQAATTTATTKTTKKFEVSQ